MTDKKSAIIIGSGIGGIATAIYLARNRYDVKIYEKTSSPGWEMRTDYPRRA